jgi:hypothetical protein
MSRDDSNMDAQTELTMSTLNASTSPFKYQLSSAPTPLDYTKTFFVFSKD